MAKPKLCLIPATIGDKVYSILPSDGVGDFDFDRGTKATRINAQGLIEEVASGENRLNYSLLDGEVVGCPHLLLEDEAINLIQYSENFSQWNGGESDVVANQLTSPSGENNATKLNALNSTNQQYIALTPTVSSGSVYTLSCFAKKGEIDYIALVGLNPFTTSFFDLNNGIKLGNNATSSSIEDFGNGWYRCTSTFDSDTTSKFSGIYLSYNGTTISNGSNISNGEGVYIYGAMLEEGSYPTSYIPTNGESGGVTRAAETCNGSGNAATFNDSEGVLMAEISALADSGTNRYITLNDGTADNSVRIYLNSNGTQLSGQLRSGGGLQCLFNHTVSDLLGFNKIAFYYKQNDFSFWINGIEIDTDTSGLTPIGLSKLSFDRGDGTQNFYGNTKQIQYFDSALTDTEIEQLTSWDSFRAMAEAQSYTIQ